MRSQATKPLPKKGALSKTTFKASSTPKQTKKKSVSPKKVKSLANKALAKTPKKNATKDNKDDTSKRNDGESTSSEQSESSPETSKIGGSKSSSPRSDSPSKKTKKEPKKKEGATKTTQGAKKVVKKNIKITKKTKAIKPNTKVTENDNDDVKYKINLDAVKKNTSKVSKAKALIKKSGAANLKKKNTTETKQGSQVDDQKVADVPKKDDKIEKEHDKKVTDNKILSEVKEQKIDDKTEEKSEIKGTINSPTSQGVPTNITSPGLPETPKTEHERPPKFFTSSRSPRMVDIDVKCCKNSKGNLSVSERFLSMKVETKNEDGNKDKTSSNNLVSQGSEIDVYTFTEKVDSPKSILSDFRSPLNKNIGRVRPIARVKGTIIDKKTDTERKKYSPHRPIEEVVKQLKANKRSEELSSTQTVFDCNSESNTVSDEKDVEEAPKPIVSKSYKMVARKSSITGKPFSPTKFLEQESTPNKPDKPSKPATVTKKLPIKTKKQQKKSSLSDEEIESSKFALNTKSLHYTSSEESVSESNDDNDTKESSESDTPKNKKMKNKKYKKTIDSNKKSCKELKELSRDSGGEFKDQLLGDKPSKRRLKLLSMWSGPKKHRMASLNAIAKVHCLYENESRTHMELGLMKTIDRQIIPSTSKVGVPKKKETKPKDLEKQDTTSESEYENKCEKKEESSDSSSDDSPPQRTLRGVPGIRSAGKYWDPKSSTSSSEDSEMETKKKACEKKKTIQKTLSSKSDSDKPPAKMKKTAGVPVKKKRNRNEVVMDLKDMVVQKRMASLNATAILAASYEKRSPKSSKDDTTSDSCSDESFTQKPKNGVASGVKSETKIEDLKKECDDSSVADRKQKVEVIVNQDTDVTITGVYSTHHEGFCTAMQYRISSTSHTQTTATANCATANCEKEGCSREDGARYTPLSALSSMQPPAEHNHPHPHPVAELRRAAGCSSAFSAPSPSAHHEPGYYQPAGPLIKESGADAERALARYHPQPHYHAPHPPVLQQYGPPYYPAELCYGRYYRPPGPPYHMPPPQPDAQMVGVGGEPYPPPQYYSSATCYQHSPQRIPYMEYRQCPCPLNTCPKNVLIGPATGKAPTGGGPDVPALAPPGAAFRGKMRVCALDAVPDTHGSGKDPPLEPEPPAAADAPRPCPLPAIGGASPKREMYDVRDKLRRAGDMPGASEALGPPSPARGSAGVCAPQPPPVAPRRARLGKEMARRSLAGDDTGSLMPPQPQHSDADDDVVAISPQVCAPIDLSSSDERSTPLVDVKKENEGPTNASLRKTDAQALKEHNSTGLSESQEPSDAAKAVKRRYSKPKLEIDMKDTQLEESCKTNGIGEHVKLQKRRKVSGEQTDVRPETITKEPKKRASPIKRAPKLNTVEKKAHKRKLENTSGGPRAKKLHVETVEQDPRLKNVAAVADEPIIIKPKTKSALLLDNLMRKNSIDAKGYASDTELNPAELFLSPKENIAQTCNKKTLNINNNVVENNNIVNGVRPNTIAAVSQLIEKKLAYKNACKVDKIDSKITHSKAVLKSPTAKSSLKDDRKAITKCASIENKCSATIPTDKSASVICAPETNKVDEIRDSVDIDRSTTEKAIKVCKISKPSPIKAETPPRLPEIDSDVTQNITKEAETLSDPKERAAVTDDKLENVKPERSTKRCKLSGEQKGKNVEKVVKLLVSKRPAIKTDDAVLVTEEACESPTPMAGPGRRARRRRSTLLASRRPRRMPTLLAPPQLAERPPPRWSNGWNFDGEHYISNVYLNNDARLDRTARCWTRMTHASGDTVSRGDCVLLRASLTRAQPFVARVASIWENPDDGEMMVSLVWFYRPEHTEHGLQPLDAPDEVFASRHRDANSVACIEDKCYVLRFNEYCRYRKRLKAAEEGVEILPTIVPPAPAAEVTPAVAPLDAKLPPSVSPELVLFCRKVYDFRSKKIYTPNK